MLLAISTRRSVGEIRQAMREAAFCTCCKRAFADSLDPVLCRPCEEWLFEGTEREWYGDEAA